MWYAAVLGSRTPGTRVYLRFESRVDSSHSVSSAGHQAPFPIHWVPEGKPSGHIFGGAFLRSGRPRGPGKAFKKVEGFRPHRFEGFCGPPGPARLPKRSQNNLPSGWPLGSLFALV